MAKKAFVYDGTQWVDIAQSTADLSNYANMTTTPISGFRNAIINGDFRINQRGFTSTTSDSYGVDRWYTQHGSGTVTASSPSFTPGTSPSGYESANYFRMVTTGQTVAGSYALLCQKIEDVRTFAGQTISISFWAKVATGTPNLSIEFEQNFGSGGSPSSTINTIGVRKIPLTGGTSWTRYSTTVTIPSISGKTLGTTANTSSLAFNFWLSAGSDFNSRTDSLGIQSNTFDIWGVQIEKGTVATPFEQRPIGTELALCQRYYQRFSGTSNANIGTGYWYGSTGYAAIPLLVSLRTNVATSNLGFNALSVDKPGTTGGTVTSISYRGQTSNIISVDFTTGTTFTNGAITHIYLNSASGYLEVSAEL